MKRALRFAFSSTRAAISRHAGGIIVLLAGGDYVPQTVNGEEGVSGMLKKGTVLMWDCAWSKAKAATGHAVTEFEAWFAPCIIDWDGFRTGRCGQVK
jgi:hypothetical protein